MEDVHFFYQKANRCYQLAWQAFDLRVAQRLNLLLRGHLAEFGVIAPQGLRNVGKLIAIVRDEATRGCRIWRAKCYRCWRHRLSSWRRRLRRSRSNSWPGTRVTPSVSAWRAFRASALSSP